MKISYNWLKDYIGGKMPKPYELAGLLIFHSFEVEEVVKKGNDWILDIDVLPNRAHDCLSYIGVAREVCALTGAKLKLPEAKIKEDKGIATEDFTIVEVKNQGDCPRYSAKAMADIKVGDSPKIIKERLEMCGLQSINNIVDIANYAMLETGQPLHSFDADKIGGKIVVRRARQGEKLPALDDKTYSLDKDILVIADSKKPIAIAGIKGGQSTGIDKNTKNIVVEAANFNQAVVRSASQKLKLKTDASQRFEQGIDPNLIDYAQNRVCHLIEKYAGGKIAKAMIDFYPKKLVKRKIKLDLDYVDKLLGVSIKQKQVVAILEKLGFVCMSVGKTAASQPSVNRKIIIEVPTRRLDVEIQEDLIEEIGRVWGYDKIPAIMPKSDLAVPERNEELFWQRHIKNCLKELNFCEVYNYSFVSQNDKAIFGWQDEELSELANPLSSLTKYLRPVLTVNLLKNVKENLKYQDEIKIFELGKIFGAGKRQSKGVREKQMLNCVLAKKQSGDELFYELKGAVEVLFSRLGISDVFFDDYQATAENSATENWHPKKSAEIKSGNQEIGFLGEVHPAIVEDMGIKISVFMFELDFDKLLKLTAEEKEYSEISLYPPALRDLAILAPQGTKIVDLLNVINSAGGKLVRDVDVFDIYAGKGIEQGKENFAFHIVFQAEDKTLSSKEVEVLMQKIISAIEKNPNWEVRR